MILWINKVTVGLIIEGRVAFNCHLLSREVINKMRVVPLTNGEQYLPP